MTNASAIKFLCKVDGRGGAEFENRAVLYHCKNFIRPRPSNFFSNFTFFKRKIGTYLTVTLKVVGGPRMGAKGRKGFSREFLTSPVDVM